MATKMKDILNKIFLMLSVALDIEVGTMTGLASGRKKTIYIGVYTFLFVTIFAIGYNALWVNGKLFICNADAVHQYLVATKYFGQYWRSVIYGFLDGNFQIPMYDFRIGMGNDIFQPISAGGFGDIFNLFTVFVPSRFTEAYYDAVVVIRPYLAGFTFSILCMYAKQKNWAILLGSLIYSFSGYVLLSGTRHPLFIIAMIYAPLLFMGLDMVLRKRKPYVLIISTFFMALTGFYLLYMITIFLIVYTIIRIHHLHGKAFWRNLFPLGLRAALAYILGLMMSAVLFLPLLIGFFTSPNRDTAWPDKLWTNNMIYYINAFISSISVCSGAISLAAIALLALTALLVKKNERNDKRHLFAFFLFALLLYIVPFGSLMMNGFAYLSNRWTFLFTLIICFIIVYMLPQMMHLGKREAVAFCILIGMYSYFTIFRDTYRSVYSLTALVMLLLTAVVIGCSKVLKLKLHASAFALTAVVTVNLIVNADYTFDAGLLNYVELQLPYRQATEFYEMLPTLSDAIRRTDKSFYRVDISKSSRNNAPLFLDYNGLTYYWSLINQSQSRGSIELENFSMMLSFRNTQGFDGRTALNTLAGVKYFAANGNRTEDIPYGYEICDESKRIVNVTTANKGIKTITQREVVQKTYKNKYALPLGYTYDKVISYDEYQGLSALEKQEAMLQAVSLDAKYKNTQISELKFTSEEIPYTYEAVGLTWENGILKTEQENASLTLTFEGKEDSETYVRISGFNNNNINQSIMSFNTDTVSKGQQIQFPKSDFYFSQHNYLCNIGYSKEPQTTVTINFQTAGIYTLDDIKVYCYPMDNYVTQVETRKEEPLENIKMETNRVTGDISLSKDKFLVLSIPYSKGWSAKIDGYPTELLQANTMFMALPVGAGEHTIELTYCTPGIKLGAILSTIGFLIFIGIVAFIRKKEKHSKETLYLSLGENCLPDNILDRHGIKSFTTPYSHGRSNIEYIIQIERDNFFHFLDEKYLCYEQLNGKPILRLKYYNKIANIYDILSMNGFEFTHHDVIKNFKHREAFERRIDRMLNIDAKVIFFYHHRYCENTNRKLLLENLNDFRHLYLKRCPSVDVIMFTQCIINDITERRLVYEFISGIHIFVFYTLRVWGGNEQDVLWASCDDDLIQEMLDKVKSGL